MAMTTAPESDPPIRTALAKVLFAFDISQAELAARSGLTRPTISDAYHSRPVSVESWIRIAKALKVPLVQISPEAAEVVRGLVVE